MNTIFLTLFYVKYWKTHIFLINQINQDIIRYSVNLYYQYQKLYQIYFKPFFQK